MKMSQTLQFNPRTVNSVLVRLANAAATRKMLAGAHRHAGIAMTADQHELDAQLSDKSVSQISPSIEILKSKIKALDDKYSEIMARKEEQRKKLEQTVVIANSPDNTIDVDTTEDLKGRIELLEQKISELQKQGKISEEVLTQYIRRILDAKKRLDSGVESIQVKENSQLQAQTEVSLQAPVVPIEQHDFRGHLEEQALQAESGAQRSDEQIQQIADLPAQRMMEQEVVPAETQSDEIDPAKYASHAQTAFDFLPQGDADQFDIGRFADENPIELKAPAMPPIDDPEKEFAPLPDLNDDELTFPLDEGESKKESLAERIKSLFKK